jgi:hypothetical protein
MDRAQLIDKANDPFRGHVEDDELLRPPPAGTPGGDELLEQIGVPYRVGTVVVSFHYSWVAEVADAFMDARDPYKSLVLVRVYEHRLASGEWHREEGEVQLIFPLHDQLTVQSDLAAARESLESRT